MIELTAEEISLDAVAGRIRGPRMGAVVTFLGVVRNEARGQAVERIEVEVYGEMALRQLEAIRGEALEKFGVEEVAIVHRFGSLRAGESIMAIAVGAAHRQQAFDACRYVIENLKRRVPIWKKEVNPEGGFWVEGGEPWGASTP